MQRLDSLKTDLEKEAFDSVDIIICVDDTAPIVLFPNQARHGPQYLTLIELQGSVIQRPRPESLASNRIYDALECNPPTLALDFVKNFDTMLRAKRIPVPGITPDYPQFVRDVLGDDVYNSYFDTPSEPTTLETPLFEPVAFTRSAGFSEFMHYHQILSNPQLTHSAAFRASKEHHSYSLLRHLSSGLEDSGKINLVRTYFLVTVHGLSIFMNNFPVLILEVESDSNKTDRDRMLLQAACLVRLGNALIKSKDPNFFIQAIYIDLNYVTKEYTFFKDESDCLARIKRVKFTTKRFELDNKLKAFEFVFRLYNFLALKTDIIGLFSNDESILVAMVAALVVVRAKVRAKVHARVRGQPQTNVHWQKVT
ncbi:hypothetical protein BJY52DRAFT_1228556 [Lactarius psammicola]|nr:hypothetical protein BJY52DRAFT_1228556 [Lactarius psammicola]